MGGEGAPADPALFQKYSNSFKGNSMIRPLQEKPTTRWLAAGTVLAYVFNFFASQWLNASYARSLFPVPYFEAQLSFDAAKIKGWYAYLMEHNTLDVYVQTQNIDFLFIASVLVLHFVALLLISRLFASGSRARRWLVWAAVLSASAPLFDALENAVSYVMLANPTQFADGWALLYSSFAAAKFAGFTLAYLVAALGLAAGLLAQVQARWSARSGALRMNGGS
jgi:hypothetical protein